jgi:nitrite reductase/ring-hydroxylating ferredoxin subunit
MLSQQQNERITRITPGTPAGKLLRYYWQPAALTEELNGERPLKRVRLLGEDLLLFRDEAGKYGLVDRHCPHRGADLGYGRLEDGGLRCPVHGWLFDVSGRCLEQPAEPAGSRYHETIRHTAYPCVERNGIIFAYLGPDAANPLAFAGFDCFLAPLEYTFAFKGYIDCNWLQALEVGIDPAHASFLHRFLEDEDPAQGYGQQFRDEVAESRIPMTRILRDYPRPEIRVENTEYGLRIIALRNLDNHGVHVRVTNQLFPQAITIPMSNEMTITQWHVPIDDVSCYWYAIFISFGAPVDQRKMREQRLQLYELPDYRPKIGKANDYGYDPVQQRTQTYTGMGSDINVHDQWAVESMGSIQDRTREHLGRTDVAIRAYRRLLMDAIERAETGGDLPLLPQNGDGGNIFGPVAIDTIAPVDDWQDSWLQRDAQRRAKCAWCKDYLRLTRGSA